MAATKKLLPEVEKFLSEGPLKMYIGGAWVDAADGSTFETVDPGDGEVLATVAEGKAQDVDRAVGAAKEAFKKGVWSGLSVKDRAVLLHRLADLVDRDGPAERGVVFVPFQDIAEVANGRRRQRLDRPGRNGVDANA